MALRSSPECRLKWTQVLAFRLARHHLFPRTSGTPVTIASAVAGIQAQLKPSAEMALWTRNPQLRRTDIAAALHAERTLVKTLAMRTTVHLLPSADFPIYIAALKTSRTRMLMNVMARIGAGAREVKGLNSAVMDALQSGPLTLSELWNAVYPKVHRKLRPWMELSWNAFRPAVIEGLICYGPDRGREATFVRVDQWLTDLRIDFRIEDEQQAKAELFRWCLRAYGPATLHDCCKWSGITLTEARATWDSLNGELAEVSIEGKAAWVLRDDLAEVCESSFRAPVVRLLPHFDSYMLAHVDKDHLVHPQFYKRVYRSQGWLSPVVLLNGRVAGVWSYKRQGKKLLLTVQPFQTMTRTVRLSLEQEAHGLMNFMGAVEVEIKYEELL
jgi:hypothetical protein